MNLKMLGVTVATACATTACLAASAGAHEFVASKTGKMSATGTAQTFRFSNGEEEIGRLECKEASAGGEAGALKTEVLELALELNKCTVLPFEVGPTMLLPVPLKFVFYADGEFEMLPGALIPQALVFSVSGAEVTYFEQGPKMDVTYKNVGERVEFDVSVTGLKYTIKGIADGTFEDGTYEGKIVDGVIGGKFSWK